MSDILDLKELELAHSGGKQLVRVGDRFHDSGRDGEWEVIGFTGEVNYSPSGIGGTPTVECKPLTEMSDWWKKWAKPNGNVDWCGDSVACCIAASRALVGSALEDGK